MTHAVTHACEREEKTRVVSKGRRRPEEKYRKLEDRHCEVCCLVLKFVQMVVAKEGCRFTEGVLQPILHIPANHRTIFVAADFGGVPVHEHAPQAVLVRDNGLCQDQARSMSTQEVERRCGLPV